MRAITASTIFPLLPLLLRLPSVLSSDVTWHFPDSSPTHTYAASDIINASWTADVHMMPLFMFICVDKKGGQTESGTYNCWVQPTGSKLLPLDIWVGGGVPYTCHFDFRDGGTGLALNSPSSKFVIAGGSEGGPVRIFSEGGGGKDVGSGDGTTTSSGAGASATATAKGTRSSKTAKATIIGAAVSSSATPTPSATHDTSRNLSPGAIAGIVVAALFLGGILASSVVYLLLRRRTPTPDPDNPFQAQYPLGWATGKPVTGMLVQEKDAGRSERQTSSAGRSEVLGSAPMVGELDAGGRERGKMWSPR